MPLSLTPMLPPATNVRGVSDRRSAPAGQAASLSHSKWPLLGSAAYLRLVRAGTTAGDAELTSLPPVVTRLAHARNKLAQALAAWDAAMREGRTDGPTPSPAVYNELRRLRAGLEKASVGFPLEVR